MRRDARERPPRPDEQAGAIVKAAPDGNTIGVVSNNHAVNPSVFKKLPYDSINDLTPISVIGSTPFLLVVNPAKVPARTARELQAFLKVKHGLCNCASSGNGTIIHLAGEMFVEAAGVDVKHIPYKGVGQQVADLIGGQVELGVVALPAVQGQLKSGALRAIGVRGKARVASLPDVPTLAEPGFPDVDVAGWFAVVGPARLPPAQVKRLHDAFVAAFASAEFKAAMARQDNVIAPTPPRPHCSSSSASRHVTPCSRRRPTSSWTKAAPAAPPHALACGTL